MTQKSRFLLLPSPSFCLSGCNVFQTFFCSKKRGKDGDFKEWIEEEGGGRDTHLPKLLRRRRKVASWGKELGEKGRRGKRQFSRRWKARDSEQIERREASGDTLGGLKRAGFEGEQKPAAKMSRNLLTMCRLDKVLWHVVFPSKGEMNERELHLISTRKSVKRQPSSQTGTCQKSFSLRSKVLAK